MLGDKLNQFMPCIFLASLVSAQTAQPLSTSSLKPGTRILAALSSQLDSTSPPGTAISADVLDATKLADGEILPKGAKILGRIIASGHGNSKHARTYLEVVFDSLQISGDKPLPARLIVHAVAPPVDAMIFRPDVAYAPPPVSPGALSVPAMADATMPSSRIPAQHPTWPMRKLQKDDKGVFTALAKDGSCILCLEFATNEKTAKTLLISSREKFSAPPHTQVLLQALR